MKKFKKFSSLFSICLTLFVVLGSFNLPILAIEKDGIDLERIRTEALPNDNNAAFDKIDSFFERD